jgi:hypothetical protein
MNPGFAYCFLVLREGMGKIYLLPDLKREPGIIPSIMTGILTVSISHILEESMTQKDIFMYAI